MATGAGFEEMVAAAREQLDVCEQTGSGCFADHPEAYADFMGPQADPGYALYMQRMASAATEAGIAGRPLETATFTTWELVPDDAANQRAAAEMTARGHSGGRSDSYHKMVDGPQAQVVDELPERPPRDDRREQIVNCAYLCGKAGVGNCPILRG